MKKTLGYTKKVVLTMLFTAACMLVGCGPKVSLAVIVGANSNAPDIPLTSKTLNDVIMTSCYTTGMDTFVSSDGDPKVVYQADIPDYEVAGLPESKKISIATEYKKQLMNELSKVEPSVSEVDTLKAITLSAQALEGSEEDSDKVLVVMSSGLSTTGYMDFTKDLLLADTKDIVDSLRNECAIPKLDGVDVIWMYLGQTAGRQKELSEKQKGKLKEIWSTVLTEGGAKSITFASDIASEYTDKGYPKVSAVNVDDRVIEVELQHKEDKSKVIIQKPIPTGILDNETVQFIGDKAEFVDYNKAVEILSEYSRKLNEYPNNKVYIVGTTATGGKEFCKQLSEDRAKAVKDVFISLGIAEERMVPIGLGFDDYWHIPDIDGNGYQIESKASQNRKVMIIDTLSEDAKHLN